MRGFSTSYFHVLEVRHRNLHEVPCKLNVRRREVLFLKVVTHVKNLVSYKVTGRVFLCRLVVKIGRENSGENPSEIELNYVSTD